MGNHQESGPLSGVSVDMSIVCFCLYLIFIIFNNYLPWRWIFDSETVKKMDWSSLDICTYARDDWFIMMFILRVDQYYVCLPTIWLLYRVSKWWQMFYEIFNRVLGFVNLLRVSRKSFSISILIWINEVRRSVSNHECYVIATHQSKISPNLNGYKQVKDSKGSTSILLCEKLAS